MQFRPPIFLLFFFTAAPLFPQIPEWASSHQDPSYPESEFLIGIGVAPGSRGEESARRGARSDIAAQLRAKLQLESKNIRQVYNLEQNQELYADFKIMVSSVADEELGWIEIARTALDTSTNTTYILAALPKKKIADTIAAGLSAGWGDVRALRRGARSLLEKGRLASSVRNLSDARTAATALLPKQALHDALARGHFPGDLSLGPVQLTADILEILSDVHVEKISGDKQKGKIGEKFLEPFVVRVTITINGKSTPVDGASVVFLNLSGEEYGEAVTDAGGIASCVIQARGRIGRQLRARLSLPIAGREFSSSLNSASAVFECTPLEADAAFSLKVYGSSSTVGDLLRNRTADAVSRAGYRIVDMSRFVLRVEIQSTRPELVEGNDEPLYSVSSNITITLIDKASNATLGSLTVKSAGKSKAQSSALEESVRGSNFDEIQLTSLLEKARN